MPARLGQLDTVFISVISVVLSLVGMVAVVMLVVGGYKFLMAGADKDAATKARATITYAIAGLILAAAAWMILNIAGNFLGINVSNFTICFPGQTC